MKARFHYSDYLDLGHAGPHAALFAGSEGPVWEVLPKINAHVLALLAEYGTGNHGTVRGNAYIGEQVYIGKGTIISHGVSIVGPTWIGENCYLAPGCYVRENTVMADHVIAGNASEFKNCVLFERTEVPHWNYVGDSILGYKAHLGAGVVLSNYRLDHGPIPVLDPDQPGSKIETGLAKFGAIIGDHVDIGSNAVISPGSLIGRESLIYPLTHWCGVLPARSVLKLRQETIRVERRFE
jgi:UDP-N-acetylglucosamine diphosphorylase / glucose-1-phosphate thymidylyltransferase / UDP-N-acetylgalactosamine diphosphorylase / glucosamine-1-phosphate N-acetyltransferase / galactosamine-1-phosphate N-acetyltransferase